jgi:hypothetical protein
MAQREEPFLAVPLESNLCHQLSSPLLLSGSSTPDAPDATYHLDHCRSMAAASSSQVTPPSHLLVCVVQRLLPCSFFCDKASSFFLRVGVGGMSMASGRG